jgi:hypothetical protein
MVMGGRIGDINDDGAGVNNLPPSTHVARVSYGAATDQTDFIGKDQILR